MSEHVKPQPEETRPTMMRLRVSTADRLHEAAYLDAESKVDIIDAALTKELDRRDKKRERTK